MPNRKIEYNLLYDPTIVAERIEDLRKGDGINNLTLEQLSKGILDKTGVSISTQQLGKYENADLKERMNINNLLAIADYYDVSIDFLIGRSMSKNNNMIDQYTSKKFGLSDKAMKRMESIKNGSYMHTKDKVRTLQLINFVLENDNFWLQFEPLLSNYFLANQNKGKIADKTKYPAEINQADTARYSLIRLFENLIDESINYLFNTPKRVKLF